MNYQQLATFIEKSEIHQKILGDYKGAYSLGVTLNPERQLTIRVRVEADDVSKFPRSILVNGEVIPIIVNTGFKPPSAHVPR
jgi:hypothetical protein